MAHAASGIHNNTHRSIRKLQFYGFVENIGSTKKPLSWANRSHGHMQSTFLTTQVKTLNSFRRNEG